MLGFQIASTPAMEFAETGCARHETESEVNRQYEHAGAPAPEQGAGKFSSRDTPAGAREGENACGNQKHRGLLKKSRSGCREPRCEKATSREGLAVRPTPRMQ